MKAKDFAVLWLLAMAIGLPLTLAAGGITITVAERYYPPTGSITATFACGCPFACGNATGADDIYLRRRSWGFGQMGRWYALGSLRNGGAAPTSVTRTFPIPAGVPEASDYVITVWNGDDSCSGDSASFAISVNPPSPFQLGPLQAAPTFRVSEPGGSPAAPTGLGMIVPIRWLPNDRDRSHAVDIDLLDAQGEIVARITDRPVTNSGTYMFWKVNFDRIRDIYSLRRRLYFGSRFKVRVSRHDAPTVFGESREFHIPEPQITIRCPRVLRGNVNSDTFFRGEPMEITWTCRNVAPGITAELHIVTDSGNISQAPGHCGHTEGGPLIALVPATDQRFTWSVASQPLSGQFPHPECDPLNCSVRIVLKDTGFEFVCPNGFSIGHR